MQWLTLTIIAIVARAIFSVASKLLSNHLEISYGTQSALVMVAATGITLVIAPDIGGISFDGLDRTWLTTLAMIASTTLGNIFFFKGLQRLDASTAQIAFSSIVIWGALLSALFLGSSFSFMQIMGIALMVVAILIIQNYEGKRTISASVLFMIAAAACFAAFQVTSADLAKSMTPATYLLLAHGGAAVIISLLYAKAIKADAPILQVHAVTAVQSVIFAAGTLLLFYLFSYYAFQAAPDRGIVVVLLTTQVVLSVILGIIFLKERANMALKIYAAIIALIASLLIKA